MSRAALQKLTERDLVVGQALKGDVYDCSGRVLVAAGEVLSPQQLGAWKAEGISEFYGGSEWSPVMDDEPTPAELLAALQKRSSAATGKLKVRRHERHECHVQVRLTILEPGGTRDGQIREIDVETCDVSASGFSFRFSQFLHAGTVIRAKFPVLRGKREITAVVRNCRLEGSKSHRIGAEFTAAAKPQ